MSDQDISLSPLKGLFAGLNAGLENFRARQAAEAAQGSKEDINANTVVGRIQAAAGHDTSREKIAGYKGMTDIEKQQMRDAAAHLGDSSKMVKFLMTNGVNGSDLVTEMQAINDGIKAGELGPKATNGPLSPNYAPPGSQPQGAPPTSTWTPPTSTPPTQGGRQATPLSPSATAAVTQGETQPATGANPGPLQGTIGQGYSQLGALPVNLQGMTPSVAAPSGPTHADPQINAAIQHAMGHPSVTSILQGLQSPGAAPNVGTQPAMQPIQPGTLGAAVIPGAGAAAQATLQGQVGQPQGGQVNASPGGAPGGNPLSQPLPGVAAKNALMGAQANNAQAGANLKGIQGNRLSTLLPAQLAQAWSKNSDLIAHTQELNYLTNTFKPEQVTHMQNQDAAANKRIDETFRRDNIMQSLGNARIAAQKESHDVGLNLAKVRLFLAQHASDRADARFEMARQAFPLQNLQKAQNVQRIMQTQSQLIEKNLETVGKQANLAQSWLKGHTTNPFDPTTQPAQHQGWEATKIYNQNQISDLLDPRVDANGNSIPSVWGELQEQAVDAHNDANTVQQILQTLSPSSVVDKSGKVDKAATKAANTVPPIGRTPRPNLGRPGLPGFDGGASPRSGPAPGRGARTGSATQKGNDFVDSAMSGRG